jgi:DNA-binding FadR family transcriptional regulator
MADPPDPAADRPGEPAPTRSPGGASPSQAVAVRRVRKAYEQVADQLRELIMTGELTPGQRLPSESGLASDFGVSRATVREALRVLAAQSLIRTSKGATGGSFVTLPTVDYISSFVHANVNLLTETERVTLDELLEARALVEVPAARLAAVRRTVDDVDRLRATVPDDDPALDTSQEFTHNAEFHTCMIEASRNTLLTVSAQPIFSVLQTNLARSTLGRTFHKAIHAHHRRILEAVDAGDPDRAETEMREHLEFLRPWYRKAWKRAASGRSRR